MDEMTVKIQTGIMKTMVSKFLTKMIQKKLGTKAKVRVDDLEIKMEKGAINFRINAMGSISDTVLLKAARLLDEE